MRQATVWRLSLIHISSLALFFIVHIARKTGATGTFWQQLDGASLVLAALAAVALLRYKVGVLPVIVVGALAGLALKFSRCC